MTDDLDILVRAVADEAAIRRKHLNIPDRRERTDIALEQALDEVKVLPLFRSEVKRKAHAFLDGAYAASIARWTAGYPPKPELSEAQEVTYAHAVHRGTVRQQNLRRDLGGKNNPLPPQDKEKDLPLFRDTRRTKK